MLKSLVICLKKSALHTFNTDLSCINGSTIGQKISFDYSQANTTIMRTAGDDNIHGNSDDIYVTKQFDDFGRTVSVQTHINDQLASINNYGYTDGTANSSTTNIKQLNRIDKTSSFDEGVENLAKNGSFERNENWTARTVGASADLREQNTLAALAQ